MGPKSDPKMWNILKIVNKGNITNQWWNSLGGKVRSLLHIICPIKYIQKETNKGKK